MIKVAVIQNPFLFTVHFADDENGLISGLGGVILRSRDGGRTWTYEETGWKQAFFSVDVDGRALGRDRGEGPDPLLHDGGSTWALPPDDAFPTLFTFMRDLGFDGTQPVRLHRGPGGHGAAQHRRREALVPGAAAGEPAEGGVLTRADSRAGSRPRSSTRRIFPLTVFGSSSTNSTMRGYL